MHLDFIYNLLIRLRLQVWIRIVQAKCNLGWRSSQPFTWNHHLTYNNNNNNLFDRINTSTTLITLRTGTNRNKSLQRLLSLMIK